MLKSNSCHNTEDQLLENNLIRMIRLRLAINFFLGIFYILVWRIQIIDFQLLPILAVAVLDGLFNQPYAFLRRRVKSLKNLNLVNIIFDIILITVSMHYLGGLEAIPQLIIYTLIILWTGIILSPIYCYLTAGLSGFCLSFLVILEHYHLLNHHQVIDLSLTSEQEAFFLLIACGLFIMVAFFTNMAAELLHERTSELQNMRDHLEEMVQEKTRALETKTRDLEEFLYTTTHDLKSPLVSIKGFADLLRESAQDRLGEQENFMLSRIEANAVHMSNLIKDLIQFARIGYQEDDAEEIDTQALVRDLLRTQEQKNPGKPLRANLATALPRVKYSPIRLRQIFENLIDNALKFTAAQAVPEITIGCREEPHAWVFFVKDNGIGIDPAYHKKIFQIFTMLRDVNAEGSGIGLAIVKRIVETNGGTIWVESTPGQGSTFHFSVSKTV